MPNSSFFGSLRLTLAERLPVIGVMNLLFFGSILVGVLLAQPAAPPLSEGWEPPSFFPLPESNLPLLIVFIFISNLVLSAFLLLTLSGMVLFVVPVGVLVWRALLWGSLASQLPTSSFLLVLPTVILEGEGYVLAAVAGIVLGLSWLKPSLIYGRERFSRIQALIRALKDSVRLYVAVAVILFVAALVEALTLAIVT